MNRYRSVFSSQDRIPSSYPGWRLTLLGGFSLASSNISKLAIGPRLLGLYQWKATINEAEMKPLTFPLDLSANFRANVTISIIYVLQGKYLVQVWSVSHPYCTLLRQSAVVCGLSIYRHHSLTCLPDLALNCISQSVANSTPQARLNTWRAIQSTGCCYSIWSSHRC